jgi:dihydroorotase
VPAITLPTRPSDSKVLSPRILEAFAALNGPRHYGLPANEATVTLVRAVWEVPRDAAVDGPEVRVAAYRGGETIPWRVEGAA